ncbi:MAG: RNA 2',3'-cyclic phosphodiesterase [candidate division Zixibacteria bacterium]|nr:RNA 2',3'-cyclic phosphodiesterase [candidate division Zixibacteria bacterium]
MPRLFIALPLADEVESRLGHIIADLRPDGSSVKWVASNNIHLTVKFLGDTDDRLIPAIIKHLETIASQFQPMSATIDRLGAFPNLRKPRVIWAGSSAPPEMAGRIAEAVDAAVHGLGFERETRKFKPHLTLGRVKQGRSVGHLPEALENYRLTPIPFRLDRLVLFKSTLTPQGALYDRLAECPLGEERFGG